MESDERSRWNSRLEGPTNENATKLFKPRFIFECSLCQTHFHFFRRIGAETMAQLHQANERIALHEDAIVIKEVDSCKCFEDVEQNVVPPV